MADMIMKQEINESMHLEKEWYEAATHQTRETLLEFFDHVMHDYHHDYGTICHALAACAIAAAWAANKEPEGGITGFQAGFVMWNFIRKWNYDHNKCGLRIIDYDNMLYPQYEEKFGKTISKDVWDALQNEARENLKDCNLCADSVVEHWLNIVAGKVPFGYTVEDRR